MTLSESELSVNETASVLDAFAHPVRLTILKVLRARRTMPLADLRREVSRRYGEVDHRNIEFHVTKMQFAGVTRMHMMDGKKTATLLMDITLPRPKRLD